MSEVVPFEKPVDILGTLERLGIATATSLDLPDNLSFDEYEAVGVALGHAHRNVTWMIADWINHGERVYGEKYAQAIEATKLNKETLKNYASVARRVPRERRRQELPFGAHEAVAALEPHEQTEVLERAVANDWRREDIRDHLRGDITPALPPPAPELADVARHLVRSAVRMGDGFLCREQAFVELCAALGEPT